MDTKKIYYLILLLITLPLIISSCLSDEDKIGSLKNIRFENNVINLSGDKHTIVIKADVPNWDIYCIKITDENGEKEYTNEFYIKKENGNEFQEYKRVLSHDWFTTIKHDSNPKELTITLDENNSTTYRNMVVTLAGRVGYIGADLSVTQKPK